MTEWSSDPVRCVLENLVPVLVHLELSWELAIVDYMEHFKFLVIYLKVFLLLPLCIVSYLCGHICVAESNWIIVLLMHISFGFVFVQLVSCLSQLLVKLGRQFVWTQTVVLLFTQLAYQLCNFLTKCMASVWQPLLRTIVCRYLWSSSQTTYSLAGRISVRCLLMNRCRLMDGCPLYQCSACWIFALLSLFTSGVTCWEGRKFAMIWLSSSSSSNALFSFYKTVLKHQVEHIKWQCLSVAVYDLQSNIWTSLSWFWRKTVDWWVFFPSWIRLIQSKILNQFYWTPECLGFNQRWRSSLKCQRYEWSFINMLWEWPSIVC